MVYKITLPILNYRKDGVIEVELLFYSHEGSSPSLEAFLSYLDTMDHRTYRESLRKAALGCDNWITIKNGESTIYHSGFTKYEDIASYYTCELGYPIVFEKLDVITLGDLL